MTKLSDEASIWREELIEAARAVEGAIHAPPPRQQGETLLAYVKRTRLGVDKHINRWHMVNKAMHDAIAHGR